MLCNPHGNIIQKHKTMQQFFKKNVQRTPMLRASIGHHPQWNMMDSNVAYARGALSTRHPTTPTNLCMFVDSWWSKQLAPLCDENRMPSMWIAPNALLVLSIQVSNILEF
jgi:hypothetical protein